MRCENCGSVADGGDRFCYKCGEYLLPKITIYGSNPQKKAINLIGTLFSFLGFMIILLVIFIYYFSSKGTLYLNDSIYTKVTPEASASLYGYYKTSIEYNTTYERKNILGLEDAKELIKSHSLEQKKKCQAQSISSIENNIMNLYDIGAVNLCEMEPQVAGSIEAVLSKTYQEFPQIKGYLTNITLMNPSLNDTFMAAFIPIFQFANSKSNINSYPLVIKSMLVLNSNYYLNYNFLNSSVVEAAKIGYFPKNANGDSIFAHEIGHFISFVALLKTYNLDNITLITKNDLNTVIEISNKINSGDFAKEVISEAYNNYRAKYPNTYYSETDFCATISDYAIISVYDETLAEGYHDYYLNGSNASPASLEIVNILKNKLKG